MRDTKKEITAKPVRTFGATGVFLCCSILTGFIILSSCLNKNESSASLFKVSLNTVDHEEFSLGSLANYRASVIVFLQPECPFCSSYGRTLRSLDSVFKSKNVKMVAAVAGKFYPDSQIMDYREKFNLSFPFLLDPDFVLKKKLNASVTPEAFFIDGKGNTIYRGMIDNWGYEIGKVRAHATEFYLIDAVNNFLAGNPVIIDSTKAVGCYIE